MSSAPSRILVSLALIVSVAVATPALAQEEEEGEQSAGTLGSFLFVYPTTLEYVADRGFTDAVTENVVLFVPAVVSAGRNSRSGSIYAVYEPEFEILSGLGEVNSWNHAAALNLSYDLSRNVAVYAGGTVLKTNDPARRIPDTVVVLPRGELFETAVFAGLAFEVGRFTTLEVRFDNTISDLDASDAFGTLAVDHQGTAGTVALSRRVGRNKSLSTSYTYLKPRLLADDALKQDPDLVWVPPGEEQHNLTLAYGMPLSETTELRLSGGGVYIDDLYWTASAEVQNQWRDFGLKVRYSRLAGQFAGFLTREDVEDQIPLPLPPGMLLKIESHLLAVTLDGYLTDTVRMWHSLRGSQSAFVGIDLDSFTLATDIGVEFRTKDTVRPFAGFEYLGDGLSAGVRRRFFAGINIHMWGPASTAGERLERVRRSAALPYGQR